MIHFIREVRTLYMTMLSTGIKSDVYNVVTWLSRDYDASRVSCAHCSPHQRRCTDINTNVGK